MTWDESRPTLLEYDATLMTQMTFNSSCCCCVIMLSPGAVFETVSNLHTHRYLVSVTSIGYHYSTQTAISSSLGRKQSASTVGWRYDCGCGLGQAGYE